MPRQARLGTPGTLHHVIIRGIEKKRNPSELEKLYADAPDYEDMAVKLRL